MARRVRRSLLGTPQPIQRTRQPHVDPEDAPPVPLNPLRGADVFDDDDPTVEDVNISDVFPVPVDPGLVHHDLAIDELDELPMDAIEIEEIEIEDLEEVPPVAPPAAARPLLSEDPDTQEAPRPPVSRPPPPRPQISVVTLDPGPVAALPLSPGLPVRQMTGAFIGGLLGTMALVLPVWTLGVSPSIERSRQETRARLGPQIIEVPKPVIVERMVPMPTPAPVEPVEPEAVAVAPVPVAPVRARPRPAPKKVAPRPRPRPKPRTAPTPAPAPAPVASVAPVAPVVVPEPIAQLTPVVAPLPKPKPKPVVPPEAAALNGKLRGKAGGAPLYTELLLGAWGRATMHVKRGNDPWTTARGKYVLQGDTATVRVKDKAGVSYTIDVTKAGGTGTVTLENGKSKPVKVSR